MATHSKILAWRIPWTGESGGRQSIGLQRVGHDGSYLACTHTQTHTHTRAEATSDWPTPEFPDLNIELALSAVQRINGSIYEELIFSQVLYK